LGLSPILHWGLRSWCSVAKVPRPLGTVLLAGLTFQEFAFVILPLFGFGPFRKDSLVHQGIEVRIDLRGKQGPEFWVQSLLEHVLFLVIVVHFLRCISGQLYEPVSVLFHRHASLLQCTEFIRLALHGGRRDVITAELLHEFLPSDGRGIPAAAQ
jgi:hypothetical protein